MEDHQQALDKCSLPPELDDLALIAAMDGEAGADVMAHLHACPACAARALGFADLQGLLRKQLFRMFCPSSDELAAYQHGMLEGGQRDSLAQHLAECPHCTRELNLLQQITHESLRPPSATNGHNNAAARSTLLTNKLRRIAAKLMPPRLTQPLAGALRGPSHTNQYAYNAENLQLTIGVQRVVNHADRRVVQGALEIDNEPLGRATAHLLHDDILIRTVELDELGNFLLDDLSPGVYRLALRLHDREVVVESLSL